MCPEIPSYLRTRKIWFDENNKDFYISIDITESLPDNNAFTLLYNLKTLLDNNKTWKFKDYTKYKNRNELTNPQKITIKDMVNNFVIYDGVKWKLFNNIV